jgi:3-hydroxybutyryl-CoA dehydrogenase
MEGFLMFKNVTVLGGGVLGTQIGLMCAYTGHKVTFWLRSESSIERTKPKIERYSSLMIDDLEKAKALVGNPMGAFMYPKGLIKEWNGITAEAIDELVAQAKKNLKDGVSIELDMAKAVKGADVVIESMAEDPKAKIGVYEAVKDLLDENTILCTNSSTMLPSTFAEYTGRPDRYLALHFANTIWKNNTAEVMGHPGTDPEVYSKIVEFAEEINMIPLQLHKEQPGYILNSMLVPFLSAAQALWANDVADPKTIDRTWELATGAPAGPFKILDIVGLETSYNINQMKPDAHVEGSITNKIGKLIKAKIDAGETGVNAGKGFYDYTKK